MKSIDRKAVMGNLKVASFLAYKSIAKGNKWVLVLIVLVMSLSFVNLTFTPSVLSGVMSTMDEQLVDTMFGHVSISPEENEYYIDNVRQLEKKIDQVPGVAGVSAHLDSSAFIEYQWEEKQQPTDKGKSGTWEVIGVDPRREVDVTTIHEQIIEGSYLGENDRDGILLGVEIAGGDVAQSAPFLTLGGVGVGEKVRLTYPNGIQREYTVTGIFRAREMTADRVAFVTIEELASVLGRNVFSDRASQILVRAEPGVDENSLIEEFRAMGIQGEMRSWREYGGGVRSVISTFEIIAGLIGGIGLIVGAIVIFIVLYIAVLNRKRQIGILRAIGIEQGTVLGSYLIQALFYAICGVVFGWLVVHFLLQPYFAHNPLDLALGLVSLNVESSTLISSVVGLIAAAALAGLVPAWTIMKQSIIKSIWGT